MIYLTFHLISVVEGGLNKRWDDECTDARKGGGVRRGKKLFLKHTSDQILNGNELNSVPKEIVAEAATPKSRSCISKIQTKTQLCKPVPEP